MPANKNALIRYRIIDRCLRNTMRPFPSKEAIRSRISFELYGEGGPQVSMSSIEKDFDAMRNDSSLGYSAPISYDRSRKGYHYKDPGYSIDGLRLNEQETEALRESAALLSNFAEIPMMRTLSEAIEKINTRFSITDWIDGEIRTHFEFEQTDLVPGRKWIPALDEAIRKRHPVNFTYNNTYSDEIREHELEPHFLRESKNAWYLLGWNNKRGRFLTYHLDKFVDLSADTSRIFERKPFDAEKHFGHSLGIMGSDDPPERVVLEATGALARSLPLQLLHKSQKTLSEEEGRLRIELTVLNNDELFRKIISMTGSIRVIEPLSLKERIVSELRKTLESYD